MRFFLLEGTVFWMDHCLELLHESMSQSGQGWFLCWQSYMANSYLQTGEIPPHISLLASWWFLSFREIAVSMVTAALWSRQCWRICLVQAVDPALILVLFHCESLQPLSTSGIEDVLLCSLAFSITTGFRYYNGCNGAGARCELITNCCV